MPPKEAGGFEIFVFSSLTPNKFGEVLGSVCDDFDYKLVATADENQNVKIRIYLGETIVILNSNKQFDYETKIPSFSIRNCKCIAILPFCPRK